MSDLCLANRKVKLANYFRYFIWEAPVHSERDFNTYVFVIVVPEAAYFLFKHSSRNLSCSYVPSVDLAMVFFLFACANPLLANETVSPFRQILLRISQNNMTISEGMLVGTVRYVAYANYNKYELLIKMLL